MNDRRAELVRADRGARDRERRAAENLRFGAAVLTRSGTSTRRACSGRRPDSAAARTRSPSARRESRRADVIAVACVSTEDPRHAYRTRAGSAASLRKSFRSYEIEPSSATPDGVWHHADAGWVFDRITPEPDDMFRLILENRDLLGLVPDAVTQVEFVRSSLVPSGRESFNLIRETNAVYRQTIHLRTSSSPLGDRGSARPGWRCKSAVARRRHVDLRREWGAEHHLANHTGPATSVGPITLHGATGI